MIPTSCTIINDINEICDLSNLIRISYKGISSNIIYYLAVAQRKSTCFGDRGSRFQNSPVRPRRYRISGDCSLG